MSMERVSMGFVLTACCLLSGCAALSSDGTTLSKAATERSGQPESSPAFRAQNHRQWIMRLKIAKPIEELAGRMPTQGVSNSLPIPLPATSTEQYALVVDQSQQLAWLQGSNSYGPFPVSNPDVTHLMNSVAAAYHEQMAWQASMQQTAVQQTAMQQTAYQQPAMPSEFHSNQQAGTSSFDEFSDQSNRNQSEWNTPSQQPTRPSSYSSEFDGL